MVKTRDIGLAAFISIREPGSFKTVEGREFVFETDKDLEEWNKEYYGSECRRHDQELMALRRLLSNRE